MDALRERDWRAGIDALRAIGEVVDDVDKLARVGAAAPGGLGSAWIAARTVGDGGPGRRSVVVGSRARPHGERDVALLEALRVPIAALRRQAEVIDRLQQQLADLWRLLDAGGRGFLVLDADGALLDASPQGLRWLECALGRSASAGRALPPPVGEWIERWLRFEGGVPATWRLGAADAGLRLRIVPSLRPGHPDRRVHYLLVEPQRGPVGSRFADLPLTSRERDVMGWLAAGKTNREIAERIGCSPRTVHKHLEHIYVKLGVENRTAAVNRALRR